MAELTNLQPFAEKVQHGEQLSHEDGLELYRAVQRERAVRNYYLRELAAEREGRRGAEQVKTLESLLAAAGADAAGWQEQVSYFYDRLMQVAAFYDRHEEAKARGWKRIANDMADFARGNLKALPTTENSIYSTPEVEK